MAFDIKIVVQTSDTCLNEIEICPSWWNLNELQEDYCFIEDSSSYYMDYILYVDKFKLIEIAEKQNKYLDEGIYSSEGWREINAKEKSELDKLLNQLNENSKIKIWIYEWESGLDIN